MRDQGTLHVRLRDATLEVPPGGRGEVRAEVANAGDVPVRARVHVTGRASGWLVPADGGDVDVPAGAARTVTLVARPPRTGLPDGLVPFAVHVETEGMGATATGLVVLSAGRLVEAVLRAPGTQGRRTTHLTFEARSAAGGGVLALHARSDDPHVRLSLAAPTLALHPDAPVTADLTVRTARPALLPGTHHEVAVDWELLGDDDVRGTARAVVRTRPLAPVPVTVVALLVLFLGAVVGARVLLGRAPLPLDLLGARTPVTTAAATTAAPVGAPYAQVGAIPQAADPQAAHVTAQTRAAELVAAGVPGVRVVDARDLPDAAAGAPAFWVLVVDGFTDDEQVVAFCEEHADVPGMRCVPSG